MAVPFLPGDAPLTIYRGDSYSESLEFFEDEAETVALVLPADGTWRAHIRPAETDAGLSGQFTVDATLAATGRITISLLPAVTAVLPALCYYDLEHSPVGGGVRTYVRGEITVLQDVTR